MNLMERAGKEIWKLQKFGEMVDELFASGVEQERVLTAVEAANEILEPLFAVYDKELARAKDRYDSLSPVLQKREGDPFESRRWITTMRRLLRKR